VPSSLVTTRQVFELVGPFDEDFPCSSDVDWMLRANHAGVRRLDVGVPLVRKRVHRRCLSLNQADLAEEIMRVIRKNRP
jgi:GT2 family glycosyltransferase